MDMRIPPLTRKILLESNPPKSRILVRRLSVGATAYGTRVPKYIYIYIYRERERDR